MHANVKEALITMGIVAVVVSVVLALYGNYEYLIFIGMFLMFLIIIYLGLSIKS